MLKTLSIACVFLAIGASGVAAKNYRLNITLDGFCNTFSLTTSGASVWGTRSGCGYTDVDGGSVAKVKLDSSGTYIVASDSNDLAEVFTWYFTPPAKKTGTGKFEMYYSDGAQQYEALSGTYSPTQSGAAHGGPDATKQH
jgi:hypothetical protein